MNKEAIKKESTTSMPEGYKEMKCTSCGTDWYVPAESVPDGTSFVCPECAKANADAIDASKAAAEAALKG